MNNTTNPIDLKKLILLMLGLGIVSGVILGLLGASQLISSIIIGAAVAVILTIAPKISWLRKSE
jgi:hypothetical protein